MNDHGKNSDDTVERGFAIRGRVQGVGFRWWTLRTADKLGVEGTVENLPDGSVAFEAALADGPPMARVDGIEATPFTLGPDDRGFRVTR